MLLEAIEKAFRTRQKIRFMKNKLSASLVIPLFNNAPTLVPLLERCYKIMNSTCTQYEVIICDDKSTDRSASLLKRYFSNNSRVRLLFHSRNQGIAKTIYELYRKAKYPYVVLFSVDGDWDPHDIQKLLVAAQRQQADIVIGKRSHHGYSFYRRAISFFYNFLPCLLFGVKTVDAGSIKVIRKELIRSTPVISKSVFFEAELIIRAAKNGKKIVSTPINFKKRKGKKSGSGKLRLIFSSVIDLIHLRFSL